jgi:hypothetical protein
MEAIRIHDENARGSLDFDLKDILAVLGRRAANSTWSIGAVEGEEEWGLDASGPASNELEELALTETRISGRRLLRLASGIQQTIWGRFVGYDASSVDPWIVVIACDSTLFEIRTSDGEALSRFKTRFKDVRPAR